MDKIHGEDYDVVGDIFWIHIFLDKILNLFHLVLILDSTYETNMYQLSLFDIVGIMSSKLKFSIGFAYLEHEQ